MSGFFTGMAVLLLAACASVHAAGNNQSAGNSRAVQNSAAAQQEAADALTAMQLAQRPPWILQPPESAEYLHFTGMGEAAGESEARNAAVRNGFAAAAGFYGNLIQSETVDHSVFVEDMGRTIAEATTYDDKTNSYTNAVVSDVQVIEYYTEPPASHTRLPYKVWALCRVSRQKAEEDRANFAKDISGRYAHLIDTQYDTMSAALHSYSAVLSALEQNPLHRAVAYYDGQDGRVGLYDYCSVRLHAIAENAGFDSLPAAAVRRGRPFTGTIRLSSGTFSEIGAVPCRVVITGKNTPLAEYPLEKNNSFTLRIPTARLEAGNYTVQLELLLNTAAPALRRNPKGAFTLEVRPVQAEIGFGGDTLSGAEQRMLSQAVQEALQTYRVPLLDGYEFLLMFSAKTQKVQITGATMLLCDVSISLNSGGSVLYQSSPEHFPEIDRNQALKKASDYIRGNKAFWTGAAQLIKSEE
jgi:hypothetical protein